MYNLYSIINVGTLRIVKHPSDTVLKVYDGYEQVVLVCEIEGDGNITAEWKRENQPVRNMDSITRPDDSSLVTSTLTITNARPSDSGKYQCEVKNQRYEITSEPAQVTVQSMYVCK